MVRRDDARLFDLSAVHLSGIPALCHGDGVDPAHDYDAIWRRDGTTIWRAVYAYAGGRREVADDAVAEAFARAMARAEEVREPVAYLYRIAFRVAGAELTRRTKEAAEMPEVATADPSANGLPDVLRALKELTPAQRAAVYLHYRADMPVREIAYLTGMSSAAVKVHLMRGRRRLRELLGEGEEDEQ
jgi:RNA polymerase sigma-70 factor, ECF subfamily